MQRREDKPLAPRVDDAPSRNALEQTRVVKKLSVTQAGALKLSRLYGEALVCVRYRHDADKRYRYTTVELVVDRAPVMRRKPRIVDTLVVVRMPFGDTARRMQAQQLGARWDSKARVWYMRHSTAKQLGLQNHILETLTELAR